MAFPACRAKTPREAAAKDAAKDAADGAGDGAADGWGRRPRNGGERNLFELARNWL